MTCATSGPRRNAKSTSSTSRVGFHHDDAARQERERIPIDLEVVITLAADEDRALIASAPRGRREAREPDPRRRARLMNPAARLMPVYSSAKDGAAEEQESGYSSGNEPRTLSILTSAFTPSSAATRGLSVMWPLTST